MDQTWCELFSHSLLRFKRRPYFYPRNHIKKQRGTYYMKMVIEDYNKFRFYNDFLIYRHYMYTYSDTLVPLMYTYTLA